MANPSVLDQLPKSNFSLEGNNFIPQRATPDWGYPDTTGQLDPSLSRLQYTYSVDGDPTVRIKDYNRKAFGGVTTVRPPSNLDELDPIAPNNTLIGPPIPGNKGPVVRQIYKSPTGKQYKDKGPAGGYY
jgi:hypothetical protein